MKCFHSVSVRGRGLATTFLAIFGLAGAASAQCEPETLGAVDIPSPHDVVISGAVAYVAAGGGCVVIDVSDPANPMTLGAVDTPGHAYGVAVSGTVACVADAPAGLQVIDVSDPSSPSIVGSLDLQSARSVALSGALAYVTAWPSVAVVDVSDPENPATLGSVEPGQGWTSLSDVAVSGAVAYVTGKTSEQGEGGLLILDVSDPANPEIVGSLTGLDFPRAVAVSGTLAYVVDVFRLYVIDVSEPEAPAMLGSVTMPPQEVADVAVSGTVAYLIGGQPPREASTMHVIDVSDPADPTILASIERPDNLGYAVAVGGTIAYMAEDDADGGNLVTFETVTCRHGACCIDEGCLDILDSVQCAAVGGTYLGHDSTCSGETCPTPCVSDVDDSGAVDFGDILRVLSDWGPCP